MSSIKSDNRGFQLTSLGNPDSQEGHCPTSYPCARLEIFYNNLLQSVTNLELCCCNQTKVVELINQQTASSTAFLLQLQD